MTEKNGGFNWDSINYDVKQNLLPLMFCNTVELCNILKYVKRK